jgi:hypothetical protein
MLKIRDFFKVNPDHDCCYIAYGGEEHRKTDYEAGFTCILTKKLFSEMGNNVVFTIPRFWL